MKNESEALMENANCFETHVSFRIQGVYLVPSDISNRLGLTPTYAHAAGDPFTVQGEIYRRRTTVWSLSTKGILQSRSLERHLLDLLPKLEPAAAALKVLLDSGECSIDFLCFWASATGHGGPMITRETLAWVARLSHELNFDFYDFAEREDD